MRGVVEVDGDPFPAVGNCGSEELRGCGDVDCAPGDCLFCSVVGDLLRGGFDQDEVGQSHHGPAGVECARRGEQGFGQPLDPLDRLERFTGRGIGG